MRLRVAALEAALAAAHAETKRLTVKNEELVIARTAMLNDMQVRLSIMPTMVQSANMVGDLAVGALLLRLSLLY